MLLHEHEAPRAVQTLPAPAISGALIHTASTQADHNSCFRRAMGKVGDVNMDITFAINHGDMFYHTVYGSASAYPHHTVFVPPSAERCLLV